MARILLSWELGNGIGYARRLASVADRLAAEGHEPVLSLRDVTALSESAHPVLQAPVVVGRLRPGTRSFVPAGFADLMACNGFGSVEHLAGIVSDWQKVIDFARPALIVAEYAPSLVLAAWRRVPTVLIGTPYLMPPAESRVFPEQEGIRPYADQSAVLMVMRQSQDARGGPPPEHVTQPFAEAARVPYSLPELDPWSRQRREGLAGLWEPVAPSELPDRPRLFAYLSPQAPGFAVAVDALRRAGIASEAFIPGCPSDLEPILAASAVTLKREPPPLAEAIEGASLILHHGGIDTAQTALALGRPQLLLPRYLDQRLSAEALQSLGTGLLLSRAQPPERLAEAVRRAAQDAGFGERARLRALLIARRGVGDALDATVKAARALLG
ncbi:MAG TPA: nucleotide disphospho-sugar-binding domain-containing protein [Alphaproteobacteria bacterium]|nr:nucleotide disphospho-sugar-binding domain-containing protein [Alphaproteobacteria bacterium]